MKAFAVVLALVAAVSANPQIIYNGGLAAGLPLTYSAGLPLTYAATPIIAPAVTKSQYHAQDEFGQASFGHSEPTQVHNAVRDAAGGVRGSFSYAAPDGRVLTTNYVADHNGYRVASNALPIAPASIAVGPAPVLDTPEVVAAKAQHFAAVAEAQARSGRKKRGIVGPALTYAAAPAFGYSTHVASPLAYSTQSVVAPALTYAAAPAAVTYAAAPAAVTYAAAPAAVTYAAAPAAVTYAAPAVRAATLTKVVNTPGHAVSYRVD